MRIVDFYEFCSLPNGTIFSYMEGDVATCLFRRGEVIRSEGQAAIDFFESCLLAEQFSNQPLAVDLMEGRWAMYDYDQKFAVYDAEDIAKIAEGLGIDDDREALEQRIQELSQEVENYKQANWNRMSEAEKDQAIRFC